MNIAQIIEQMNKDYMAAKKYDVLYDNTAPTISDINNGFQVDYSLELAQKLFDLGHSSIVYDLTMVDIPHLCVRFNDLYYDCEAPNGVKHPHELPIFASNGATADSPITWHYQNDHFVQKDNGAENGAEKTYTRIKI